MAAPPSSGGAFGDADEGIALHERGEDWRTVRANGHEQAQLPGDNLGNESKRHCHVRQVQGILLPIWPGVESAKPLKLLEPVRTHLSLLTSKTRERDNAVAIVTGATSGIGEKIAEIFVQQGATVIATGRRETEGAILKQRLGLTFIRSDVSKDADVAALFDEALRQFGQVDCLVNNAGSSAPVTPLADLDMAVFDRIMNVNIRGLVVCMKHAAAAMVPGAGLNHQHRQHCRHARRFHRIPLFCLQRGCPGSYPVGCD
jgi:short chain dehydrogenase